jgi:hypothetical protein
VKQEDKRICCQTWPNLPGPIAVTRRRGRVAKTDHTTNFEICCTL